MDITKLMKDFTVLLTLYLLNLISLITGPKEFIKKRSAQNPDANLVQAFQFAFISFFIFVIGRGISKNGNEVLAFFKSFAIFFGYRIFVMVVIVAMFIVILWLAWRMVFFKINVKGLIITYAFYAGAIVMIVFVFSAVSDWLLDYWKIKPVKVSRELIWNHLKEMEFGKLKYPMVKGLPAFISLAWAWMGWGAYRELEHENTFPRLNRFLPPRLRSGLALLIALALSAMIMLPMIQSLNSNLGMGH